MTAKNGPPRLGRGLAALLGEANQKPSGGEGSLGPANISVDALVAGPFQPRTSIDAAALLELTDSIRTRGVLQALLVRRHPTEIGQYQIIAGERRWRAAQAAGLLEVPALVRNLADSEAFTAALVENLQRQDLDPIEEAEGYKRLVAEYGMTQESLATAVGKSRSHVANTMRLLNLSANIQGELKKGRLSAGHARALLSHPDAEKAAADVIARGLSVRQTEALAARPEQPPLPQRGHYLKDPDTASLERQISEKLGLKVEITFNGKTGAVKIQFGSLDQLDGLVALLNR